LKSSKLVYHIDGDIQNNDIYNLELITRSEHKKSHSEIGLK